MDGGISLGFWFADVGAPPFLPALLLDGWETRFEEHYCEREHWVPDSSGPSELKIRKSMIPCKTTYNWLTSPSTGKAKPSKEKSGVTTDGFYDICALEYSLARRHLILLDSI